MFKVLDSVVPVLDADSDVSKAVTGELRQQMTEDMLSEVLGSLQTTMGVTINQTNLRTALGAGPVNDGLN